MRFKNFSKLVFVSIFALFAAFAASAQESARPLPANSGKVAFIKSSHGVSKSEEEALAFFKTICSEDNVITTEEASRINSSDFDCIWIHIDRYDIGQGYMNLPAEFIASDLTGALKNFLHEGGNILLTGHATQLLVALNRIDNKFAPNQYWSGNNNAERNNADDWTINPKLNSLYDHFDHAIYKDLTVSTWFNDHDPRHGQPTFGMLYGVNGESIHRDDHNCMWILEQMNDALSGSTAPDRILKFEQLTWSSVLGTWGQTTNDAAAGIVEFYPLKYKNGNYQGTVIANGMAACQWSMPEGQINANKSNLERLTANMIAYLADPEGKTPERPENYPDSLLLDMPRVPETLASNGKVGLYVGYTRDQFGNAEDYINDTDNGVDHVIEREKTLCGNFEEKAAYDWFVNTYGEDNVIFADELDKVSKKKFDCIWIHASRAGIASGFNNLPEVFKNDALKTRLNAFVNDGGNLYLTKHAVQIAVGMGRVKNADGTAREVNVFGSNSNDVKTGVDSDPWNMSIVHYDNDWSDHVLFANMQKTDTKLIPLMTGNHSRLDYNCLWLIDSKEAKDEFCKTNNCEVLGTWGHNGGQNGVGMVMFYPQKTESANTKKQFRITDAGDVVDRRGTILVNGLAAYQWNVLSGENGSKDNIEAMTNGMLQYLSPVVDEETIDKKGFADIKDFYSLNHIQNKGYVYDEDTGEGYHDCFEYKIEHLISHEDVQYIDVTPIKDAEWISNHTWDDAVHGATPKTHAYYHGWYFGEPYATVDANDDFLLYANLAGNYAIDLTTIYGNTYHFVVEIFPCLSDENISFSHMDYIEGNQVIFGHNLKQEDRNDIQLFTNHWGPIYYIIEYKDSNKAKLFRVADAGDAETAEEWPVADDGTKLTNKSTTNKFDLRNAQSMMFAQSVNGVMSNVHKVGFEDVPTAVNKIMVADNSPVRFFTLDGKQISFPTLPGIYVKVENGKASKILVTK